MPQLSADEKSKIKQPGSSARHFSMDFRGTKNGVGTLKLWEPLNPQILSVDIMKLVILGICFIFKHTNVVNSYEFPPAKTEGGNPWDLERFVCDSA